MNLVSEVDPWTLSFLVLIGKTELCSERAYAAIKAEDVKTLPPFWPELSMISHTLQESFKSSYKDVRSAIDDCIIIKKDSASVDPDSWKRAQLLYDQAAWRMKEDIRERISVLSKAIVIKAKLNFTKQLESVKEEKLIAPVALNQWDQWLHKATADHIENFTKDYPGRILHPQLERQLSEMMAAPDRFTKSDMFRAKQKLDRIMAKDPYWENMPSIEVSRLWHAEGIMLASEKGVAAFQIVNPMDKRTCPVCQRLHGMVYRVEDVKQKVVRWSATSDPEEIKGMFPFPRAADVARDSYVTQQDIINKGFSLPPYHGRCRDEIRYLWRDRTITYDSPVPDTPKEPVIPVMPKGWFVDKEGFVSFNTVTRETKEEWILRLRELGIISENTATNIRAMDISDINTAFGLLEQVAEHAPLKNPLTTLKFKPLNGMSGGYADSRFGPAYDGPSVFLNPEKNLYILRDFPNPKDYLETNIQAYKDSIKSLKRFVETLQNQTLEDIEKSIFWIDDPAEIKKVAKAGLKANKKSIKDILRDIKEEQAKLDKLLLEDAEALAKTRILSGSKTASSYADAHIQGTSVHEYGHAWHCQNEKVVGEFYLANTEGLPDGQLNNALKCGNITGDRFLDKFKHLRVTEYSETNLAEMFAENFTMYMMGQVKYMNTAFVKFFDGQFPTLSFGRRLVPEIYNAG